MEATMHLYTLNELFRLTRHELFALHAQTAALIAALPDDAPEREVGLSTLRLIRSVLAQPALSR
jgi:hypothetical protein